MSSYLWVASTVTAVVACVSAWFGLNLQPFTLNTFSLQRQFAITTAPKAPTTGPFTFYKLSLQWPAAACNSGRMTCKQPIPKKFTIHGIWPQDSNDDPVPAYGPTNPCTTVRPTPASNLPTELNPILSDLQSLWPNLKDPQNLNQNFIFWAHEWTKHGMCSDYPNDPHDYFNSAVLLRNGFDPDMGLTPGSNYTVQQVAAAVQTAVGAYPEIACNRDKVTKTLQLWEIRLCYKRAMPPQTVQNCPKSFSGQCRSLTDNIYFPN
ncbi:ribonuclease MC-like [Durio zibethinus]|uniref:Ribonuclease MC-like n=1 Tax=Durio zibethinus TaxID=66656 RepID=A0A6P5ZVY0_DURZI|nr:ribonuclease MC-like [Durio zibethinus]